MKLIFMILMMLSLALVAAPFFADDLTGVITETKCGVAHNAGSEKDVACIKRCVNSGAGKLALLVGDNLYTITNPEKATGHEGHRVMVTGKTDEAAKTVTIKTLVMAPLPLDLGFLSLPNACPLFRRVNAVEPDLLTMSVVHYRNGVVVRYSNDPTAEIKGTGRQAGH